MKRCPKCRLVKDFEEFGKNSQKSDGLQTFCKDCKRKDDKLYYRSHSPLMKKQILLSKKKRIQLVQKKLYEYLSTHPCIDCGENNIIVLEFDHIKDKQEAVSVMINNGLGWEHVLEEISKCVVRCANCHRIKTAKQFNWHKNESLAQR